MKVRRLGREIALGALYQVDVLGEDPEVALPHARDLILTASDDEDDHAPSARRRARRRRRPGADPAQVAEAYEFAGALVRECLANIGPLDAVIERYAQGWTLSRMASVDRNILRIALAELVHFEDIPVSVSIDEAVDLAKEYSTEESGKFVNGILGTYAREEGLVKVEG